MQEAPLKDETKTSLWHSPADGDPHSRDEAFGRSVQQSECVNGCCFVHDWVNQPKQLRACPCQ
eukprot:1009592-Lingulodinium_polyedra.AAC.1